MTTILVAAEAAWIRDQVRTALVGPGQQVIEVTRGQAVRAAVAEHQPDLVILDLQIANMGGVAVSIDLRLEEGGGRLPHVPVLLLLDREADRFLAQRADADVELVKPINPGTLRRAVKRLLAPVRPVADAPALEEAAATDEPEVSEVAPASAEG